MPDTRATTTRRISLVLGLVGLVLVLGAMALYAARKVIAREALTGWLERRGVASSAEVEAFGPSGFTARMSVGDPARPDFAAARVDVRYRIKGFGVEVGAITLREPVVRASIRGGRLSVGALDPIIAEFRRRPPRPDAAKPRIVIDDGLLLLATDYGPVRLRADARVEDGKLISLAATSAPAQLKGPSFSAGLGIATVKLATRGGRVAVVLDAPILQAAASSASVRAARLQMRVTAPYPDLVKRRGDGAVTIRAILAGERLDIAGQRLDGAQLAWVFAGQAAGWIPDLVVTGAGSADLRAGSGALGSARSGALTATASASDLRWTRQGGDRVTADLRVTGLLRDLTAADLTLTRASGAFSGPMSAGRRGLNLNLSGYAEGRGGWSGLGPPGPLDSAHIIAVKRAARSFAFAAPGVGLQAADGFQVRLPQPVRISPASGGLVQVSARAGAPLFGPGGGALRLTTAGGGLPRIDADVASLRFADGATTAQGRVQAGLSIGPIVDGRFDAAGTLRIADGISFTGDRCASITAPRLEFGENDATGLSGRLCPAGAPLLAMRDGDWRIRGRGEAIAAAVPFLQARVTEGAGTLSMGQSRGALDATIRVAGSKVEDTAPRARFNPLRMSGAAALARDTWTADLAFSTPAGQPVAIARLAHDGRSGRGGVDVDTGLLAFADGGLQPAQLSPLAAAVGSPAQGQARFTGAFTWTGAGVSSRGALSIRGMDFESPAGRVTGLSGDLVLTSLAPLIAAPGQVLRATQIDAFAPLTGVTATFALEEKAIRISGGEAAVGGGRVVVESLEIPLDPKAATRGVLVFEGVQLAELVEASPFGDRVDLDAKVSGRVPFETEGQRVRILGGTLKAIQPGRLSIQRTALSGVIAQGEVTVPVAAATPETNTDTFTDFAYQAMENLAFDTLDATIESRADGRLGVLFHIVGRHDPPQKQEIRLSLGDLIGRKFLNRKLPLPSDTGVNLTLDTTLNLDDLLSDYRAYRQLRSSGPVQP